MKENELFVHRSFTEAMGRLEYFVKKHGIFLLTGAIGVGKTTLLKHFKGRLSLQSFLPIYLSIPYGIFNPFSYLLHMLQVALRLTPYARASKAISQIIDGAKATLSEGKRIVLIADEAQNMDARTLKNLKVFVDMEGCAFIIILSGQSQLRGELQLKSNEDIFQRITLSYHLKPMEADEIEGYVRMLADGWNVSKDGIKEIELITRGIPRLVDKALFFSKLYAESKGERIISAHTVQCISGEINPTLPSDLEDMGK